MKLEFLTKKTGQLKLGSVCLFLAISFSAAHARPQRAGPPPPGKKSVRARNLTPEARAQIRQAVSAVGMILIRSANDPRNPEPKPRGSGVIVRSDGVVVTNYHVIADDSTNHFYPEIFFNLASSGAEATSTSHRYRLKPILTSKDYDLALLRIESDSEGNLVPGSMVFPTIELGDSKSVELLDDLTIIGFPEKGGLTVTVNPGVVEGKDILGNWIKTDARVIHGNSGGAAVNNQGKLVGIPTKVYADARPIDKNGDGFPDEVQQYGAVGFLRPSNLVAAMLGQLDNSDMSAAPARPAAPDRRLSSVVPKELPSTPGVEVRGIVRTIPGGKVLAGVRVGLIPLGSDTVTKDNLLTWGGTNADGEFVLNQPVPPGRYTLKATALGFKPYSSDVEIGTEITRILIEMQPSNKR